MDSSDIKNLEAEAGVIATLIHHPDYFHFAEDLTSNMFTDMGNAMLFFAIKKIVEAGGTTIDALSITNALNLTKASKEFAESTMTVDVINDIIETGRLIARDTVQDYMVLVSGVKDSAFRREMYDKLAACQRMCFGCGEEDIQQKVYSTLDDVMLRYSSKSEIPSMPEVADQLWALVCEHQKNAGFPFKFPTLSKYLTIERSEFVVTCASQKAGKSIFLLNEAVDLLNQGLRVLYVDSELSSRTFFARLMAHLTGIEFTKIKSGTYSEDEKARIDLALQWTRKMPLTHIYLPTFDPEAIFMATKKVSHTMGLDVIIIDYLKSGDAIDAYANYSELGNLTNMIKNNICGDMNLAGLGACQLTSTGKVADSARIARNCSSLLILQDKTPEEIATDGYECGNKKLTVRFNRNGPQMLDDEYIDLRFVGNHILFEEAEQHVLVDPY